MWTERTSQKKKNDLKEVFKEIDIEILYPIYIWNLININ